MDSRVAQELLTQDGKTLVDFASYLKDSGRLHDLFVLWQLAIVRFSLKLKPEDYDQCAELAGKLEVAWGEYANQPGGCSRLRDAAQWGQKERFVAQPHAAAMDLFKLSRTRSGLVVPEEPVVAGGPIINQDHLMYEFAVAAMFGIHVAVVCQSIFDDAVAAALLRTGENANHLWSSSFPNLSVLWSLQNAVVTYRLPPEGTAYSPPTAALTGGRLDVSYCIDDICPQLFAQARHLSGVSNERYYNSICRPDIEFVEFRANSKSKEIFFFSHDGMFLLKTMTRREAEALMRMLPDLLQRYKVAPHSLLGRYLGMYRVHGADLDYDLLFFVMLSVTQNQLPVTRVYDLKGSTIGRRSNVGDFTRKDVNFLEEVCHLHLHQDVALQVVQTHEEDLQILRRHGIVDYSVLLHIHDRMDDGKDAPFRGISQQGIRSSIVRLGTRQLDTANEWSQHVNRSTAMIGLDLRTGNPANLKPDTPLWRPGRGIWSSDGRYLYTLGIIDMLIPFYWKKQMEAAKNQLVSCGGKSRRSVVHPEEYADRQVEMMHRICRAEDQVRRSSAEESSDEETEDIEDNGHVQSCWNPKLLF